MRYKRKYPAFTIWEVLTAMVLTSLIVAFSYGSYRKFVGIVHKDQRALSNLNDMVILEKELFNLVESSQSIEQDGRTLYFNFPDSFSYAEFTDTSFIIIGNEMIGGKQWPLVDWSVRCLYEEWQYIKSIKILCQYEGNSYCFSFEKTYPKIFKYRINQR